MYLACPPRFEFHNRIATPRVDKVCLQLLLAGPYPWAVVSLGSADALMPKEDRNALDGHARQAKFDRSKQRAEDPFLFPVDSQDLLPPPAGKQYDDPRTREEGAEG